MLKKLMSAIKGYWLPTIVTLVLMVGEVVLETFIPFITAQLVDDIKAGIPMEELIKTGLLLVLMAVLSLSCGGVAGYTGSKASSGFAANLRSQMFSKIQTFSFENIDKFSSASLVTRMTTDINNVQMSFMMLIRIAVRSPLMFIFSSIMAYVMGGPLALTFVIVVPILLLSFVIIGKICLPSFQRIFKKYDKVNQSIEENIRGMRVVKGFARENYEKEKFGAASEMLRVDFTKAERVLACARPVMQFCIYFNSVFVLLIGSRLVLTSGGEIIDVGELSAMLTYGVQILMSLMMLSMIIVTMTMSIEATKRIAEVLNEESSLHNPQNPVMEVKDGSIDFDHVSFKYSATAEKNTLNNIDLHIKSGSTIGILGTTGSGKTSLISLIPRLYDVTEGTLKVGGTDVRKYDMEQLREQVAIVLQKNELFSGTISENLRWGNPEASQEDIEEACRLAQAHDFILAFPDGYETHIEQGGTNVSGGQKQRLCIARALLKKPKILILDDSTSAVDMKTDALIRKGFKEYIPETTKINIAQRVASVADSDAIVIMDNGEVKAVGTHDELLKTSPIYQEIYNQQTKGDK